MSEIYILNKITEKEINSAAEIPYAEFRKNKGVWIPEGTLITGVKPAELFATQRWLDPTKTIRALNRDANDPEIRQTKGWIVTTMEGKWKLALGDGHHRSIRALCEGERVDFEVIGQKTSLKGMLPLPALRNMYGGDFLT